MRQLLLFSCLFLHLFAFAQEDEAERLVEQLRSVSMGNEYDSIILLHGQLKQLDRGAARESRNLLYLVQAHLGKDDIRSAKRYARKIYRKPGLYNVSLKGNWNRAVKRYTREYLFRYYYDHGNKQKAAKQLVKVTRKKQKFGCGYGRHGWYKLRYTQIIECYTDLGKTRKAEKYRRKLEAL